MDGEILQDWLNGKEMAFACVLAARASLHVMPILEITLNEDEDRRRSVVLPAFRALAAVNFAGSFPKGAEEVRNVARSAGQEAQTAIDNIANDAQMNLVHAREALSDFDEGVFRYKLNARHSMVAGDAVNTVVEVTQSVVAKVDVEKEIGSPASLIDAVISVAQSAHAAIDGIHGGTEYFNALFENEESPEIPQYIAEFWCAVAFDVEVLKAGENAAKEPEEVVAELSKKKLWHGGTPKWARRRWVDFKDKLPDWEGWGVWIDLYEKRLKGQGLIAELEIKILKIAIEEWRRGPAQVNAIIAKLVESRSDPQKVVVVRVFEDDLEQVKQVTSIELQQYYDWIQDSLQKDDPYKEIGSTKDMLEATMKSILDRRRKRDDLNRLKFSNLTTRCFMELRLIGDSPPATDSEKYVRKFASRAKQMIETANELRNIAGTGHG